MRHATGVFGKRRRVVSEVRVKCFARIIRLGSWCHGAVVGSNVLREY